MHLLRVAHAADGADAAHLGETLQAAPPGLSRGTRHDDGLHVPLSERCLWLLADGRKSAAPRVNSRRPNAEATGAARRRGADVVTAGRRGAAVKACTRWRAASMGTGSTALGVGVVRYLLRKYTHGVAMRTWSSTTTTNNNNKCTRRPPVAKQMRLLPASGLHMYQT